MNLPCIKALVSWGVVGPDELPAGKPSINDLFFSDGLKGWRGEGKWSSVLGPPPSFHELQPQHCLQLRNMKCTATENITWLKLKYCFCTWPLTAAKCSSLHSQRVALNIKCNITTTTCKYCTWDSYSLAGSSSSSLVSYHDQRPLAPHIFSHQNHICPIQQMMGF